MRRVMYVLTGPERIGGCEIYRVTIPATAVNQYQQEYQVEWMWMSDLATYQYNLAAFVRQYDIFVFPRFYVPADKPHIRVEIAKLFRVLRNEGVRILYEIDDDYSNEFRQTIHGDPMEIVSWTDGCIVTTPLLAERMEAMGGVRAYVCPNSIMRHVFDPGFTGVRKKSEKLTFLLSGSPTHYEDWRVLGDVLPKFMAKHAEQVELWIGGFHPDYLADLPSTVYIPALSYEDYARVVQGADVVLCPVVPDDGFNKSKSEIKAVEGMGAGAFVIATDNPVYRLAVTHLKTGYLVQHTEIGWTGALEYALKRHHERGIITRRGFKYAWKHYDAAKNWMKWVSVFNKVIRKHPNNCILPIDSGYPIK
jgi:glycosyltransferase involved in cell wall biosynthesis